MKTTFLFGEDSDTVIFKAGQVIFDQGEEGDSMYAIIEGKVDIILYEQVIHTVLARDIFGEMSLIDREKRSATAIAKTDCKINIINQQKFRFFVEQNPDFAIDVMAVLSHRIRSMNELEDTSQ